MMALLARLSRRDRRAVTAGLVIVLPVLLFVLVVRPYGRALESARGAVELERQALARELALVESANALPEAIQAARRTSADSERRLIRAESPVLAEAVLTDHVEVSAARSRVLLAEIRSVTPPRGEEPPPELSVVRLSVRGESDLEGVLTFLDRLERSALLTRVRALALEPVTARPQGAEDSADPIATGVVTFEVVLEGYARPAGAGESTDVSLQGATR